ncbi:RING finger domain-containing protein, partial [Endozoicomonas sp. ALC013]
MNSANGLIKCAICYDSICCDSTKYKSIELICGHAFGKSCMRKWVESSNQKKCPICTNQLTDNKLKEIKNIPLQERVVIISEKTIKLTGRTILEFAPAFAVCGAFLGAALWAAVGAEDGAVAGV